MVFARPATSDLSHRALQFARVLDGVLSKLSRYDEGTLFSSILSFTVSPRLLPFHLLLILPQLSSSFLLLPSSLSVPPLPLAVAFSFSSSSFSFFQAARCLGRRGGAKARALEVKGPGLMSSGHQV